MGQHTFCQDRLRRFVRKTFWQDWLRCFVRKTFCQDLFIRQLFQADRLRRFVRTALWVVRCDDEWLWGGFKVVIGGFRWFLVVTSGCRVDTGGIGGFWWLWLVMVWLRLVMSGFDLLELFRPTP